MAYTRKHAKVLDVGCGNGRLYEFLLPKEIKYLGIDHNSHLLDMARKRFPDGNFQLDDMMKLELQEKAFDNVFCIAVFHHAPTKKTRKKILYDIHRSLKDDCILILTVWNLFQPKYFRQFIKSIIRFIFFLGLKSSWNDFWIKWGNYPLKRYYHSFLPGEFRRLFTPGMWEIEEFYFTRKGKRVSFLRSFNLVVIARKK